MYLMEFQIYENQMYLVETSGEVNEINPILQKIYR